MLGKFPPVVMGPEEQSVGEDSELIWCCRSPLAVPAGHYANVEHVMEHYRRRNKEEDEKNLKKLKARKQAGTEKR